MLPNWLHGIHGKKTDFVSVEAAIVAQAARHETREVWESLVGRQPICQSKNI
jgi:hypothetical protein